MKKYLLVLMGILTMANPAFADKLDDVTILEVLSKKDALSLKLHAKSGPQGSYFFVDVLKSDTEAFDKLVHVAQKLQKGEAYKLSLDIKSFSMEPSGSKYRSPSVKFFGGEGKK